eukprot:13399845-Alexandrium_andersonii.AAC.1
MTDEQNSGEDERPQELGEELREGMCVAATPSGKHVHHEHAPEQCAKHAMCPKTSRKKHLT